MYELKSTRHAKYLLHTHLVFTPKYRKKVFNQNHLSKMKDIFKDLCEQINCELIEFNGEEDHVHLLVLYLPRISIASLVNTLKGVSSRLLRKEFKEFKKVYWGDSNLWSRSYFSASVGGAPLEILKEYIEGQKVIE